MDYNVHIRLKSRYDETSKVGVAAMLTNIRCWGQNLINDNNVRGNHLGLHATIEELVVEKVKTPPQMLIEYWVAHNNIPSEIKLCGIFRDMEHFRGCVATLKDRGWETQRYTIITEVE